MQEMRNIFFIYFTWQELTMLCKLSQVPLLAPSSEVFEAQKIVPR